MTEREHRWNDTILQYDWSWGWYTGRSVAWSCCGLSTWPWKYARWIRCWRSRLKPKLKGEHNANWIRPQTLHRNIVLLPIPLRPQADRWCQVSGWWSRSVLAARHHRLVSKRPQDTQRTVPSLGADTVTKSWRQSQRPTCCGNYENRHQQAFDG